MENQNYEVTNISRRFHSIEKGFNVVANTEEIYDPILNEKQDVINNDVYTKLNTAQDLLENSIPYTILYENQCVNIPCGADGKYTGDEDYFQTTVKLYHGNIVELLNEQGGITPITQIGIEVIESSNREYATISITRANINNLGDSTEFNFTLTGVSGNAVNGKIIFNKVRQGKSAYEVWKDAGNEGNIEVFLASLKESGFTTEAVDELPTTNISTTTIYAVPKWSEGLDQEQDESDMWAEYIYVDEDWKLLATHDGSGLSGVLADISELKNDVDSLETDVSNKVDRNTNATTIIVDGGAFDAITDESGNAVVKAGNIPNVGNGIQAADFFDKKGNSITGKIKEIDENVSKKIPKESTSVESVSDLATSEVWCDGDGNIGMYLDEQGILHVRGMKTSENKNKEGEYLLLDSNTNVTLKDGANAEIWCDRFGNIGMILTGNGMLMVSKIVGELSGNIENKIAFPKYIYCLAGIQRNFWHRSLLARWNPNDYYLQFGGTAPYQRRTPLVATIKNDDLNKLDGKKLELSLIDYRKMKSVQKIENVAIRAALPKSENDGLSLIKVMFVGSSTTQSCYFSEALARYVSNYQLIGLRHRPPELDDNDELIDDNDENFNIIHEAHGGCTLGSFFDNNPSTGATAHFFPFMQPNGNYRYWGATGFWKFAHINKYTVKNQNDIEDEEHEYHPYAYNNGCYIQSALDRFNSDTGLLVSPTSNDIMYDTDNSRFIKYDGSDWQVVAKGDYEWTFQFGKYIDMWGLDTPDVVVITLGSNDFREADLPIDFTRWNAMADEFIDSVKAKNQNAKVVLCSQGPFGENGYDGLPVAMLNYKCWLHFKNLIDMFGNLESQGVYVLDQTSELSAEYGFPVIMTGDTEASQSSVVHTFPMDNYPLVYPTELYHDLYTHDGKGSVAKPYFIEQKMTVLNADSVHPQMSYANMGIPVAAFLQYIRQNN